MRRTAVIAAAGLGLAVCAGHAPAERVPEAAAKAPAKPRVQDALKQSRKGLKEGQAGLARLLLTPALGEAYLRPPVIEGLLEAAAGEGDAEAQILWAHALAAAASDATGGFTPGRSAKAALPKDDPHIAAIAKARAAAAKELASQAETLQRKGKSLMGTGVGARWAVDLGWEVVRQSPALVKAHGASFNRAVADFAPDPVPVLEALERLIDHALAKDDFATAIEVARCLRGFVVQGRFKDLQGPRPKDLQRFGAAANRALGDARKQQEAAGKPLTLEQLEAMSPAEREQFTRDHSGWKNPGIAISAPKGLYRIETNCGFETLLGAVKTAELHHRRLVSFFKRDPCEGVPGIIRIVPDSAGLESEGAPYWWAGGFQSGDATTVKFSVGNIETLGRVITHELTHRFDGRAYGGFPGWLSEGRAVYTEHAYGHSTDTAIVDHHVNAKSVEAAYMKQYGSRKMLEQLLTGTIDDYRDNYTAGYALWVFLSSWDIRTPHKYRPRLEAYLRGINTGSPVSWFAKHFADGKDGRPKGMKQLAEEWAEFLRGFYWQDRPAWVKQFAQVERKSSDWVYDAPTWHRKRTRAEPWFGQDQARVAGDLLRAAGNRKAAALAYAWALEVDEWSPRVARALAELLDGQRAGELAWILRAENERRRPAFEAPQPAGPAPFARSLSKVQALLAALEAAATHYAQAGQLLPAAAMTSDRNRIAAALGVAPIAAAPIDPKQMRTAKDEPRNPLDEPAAPLGLWGWVEDGLVDYEARRAAGLWTVDPQGDLIVGFKNAPKERMRGAPDRDAFVRGREWHSPGRYLITTRIFMLTTFVEGAVVLGFQRRDQNLRAGFRAGDFNYSVGRRNEAKDLADVGWSLGDQRGRDGGLLGSAPRGRAELPGDRYLAERWSFKLEVLVDGAEVHLFVEDQWVGTYASIHGLPVEGYVGFATKKGAFRVQAPSIRRLDRQHAAGLDLRWPHGLDPQRPNTLFDRHYVNRHVAGITPKRRGTLLIWVPVLPEEYLGTTPEERTEDVMNTVLDSLAVMEEERFTLHTVLAIPSTIAAAEVAMLKTQLPPAVELLVHRHPGAMASGKDPLAVNRHLLMLLDEHGVLRCVAAKPSLFKALPHRIDHWARVLRGR